MRWPGMTDAEERKETFVADTNGLLLQDETSSEVQKTGW